MVKGRHHVPCIRISVQAFNDRQCEEERRRRGKQRDCEPSSSASWPESALSIQIPTRVPGSVENTADRKPHKPVSADSDSPADFFDDRRRVDEARRAALAAEKQQQEFRPPARPARQIRHPVHPIESRSVLRNVGSYHVSLVERALPSASREADSEAIAKAITQITATDFALKSVDGTKVPCHEVLLANMCSILDISPAWQPFTSLELAVDRETVERVTRFMYSGSIEINQANVEQLMGAADFLGFNALVKLCVEFVSTFCGGSRLFLRLHEKYSHATNMEAAFQHSFSKLPVDVFAGRGFSMLKELSGNQIRILLRCDNLRVRSEDDAVEFLLNWVHAAKPSQHEIAACLQSIRRPYITSSAASHFKEVFIPSNNLPAFEPNDFDRAHTCKPRKHYDRHIHVLWKERVLGTRGPSRLRVACLTWTARNECLEETTLFSCEEPRLRYGDPHSAMYKTTEDAFLVVTQDRYRGVINISHLNLRRQRYEKKCSIDYPECDTVVSPDFTLLKNPNEVCLAYFDSDRYRSSLVSVDAKTWTKAARTNVAVDKVQCATREMQIYDDCTVAITYRTVYVLRPNDRNPRPIPMPRVFGFLADFERIGDNLFVLESVSDPRHVQPGKFDRIHCIDLKRREYQNFATVPHVAEQKHMSKYHRSTECCKKLLNVESELYVLVQLDNDEPLHVFHFDVASRRCLLAFNFAAPIPDEKDFESVHGRAFVGIVPFGAFPCPRRQLRDLA